MVTFDSREILDVRKHLGVLISIEINKGLISLSELSDSTQLPVKVIKDIMEGRRGYTIDEFLSIVATLNIEITFENKRVLLN